MDMKLIPFAPPNFPPPACLRADMDAAQAYAREQHSPATRRAYRADLSAFTAWCRASGLEPLPASPEAVAAFLAAEAAAGAKASTLGRRVAAIRYAHALAGLEPPTAKEAVRATIKGIRRAIGAARTRKAPATAERVMEMVALCPDTLAGKRDRALLLLGFAGALRRSELVALQVADLEDVPEGLRLHIRRSKTDQEGEGVAIAIPRGARVCPVAAVKAWLAAAGISDGPVFRPVAKGGRVLQCALTGKGAAGIVKLYAARAGFNAKEYSGHSLRAGFLTSAAARGASVFKMMDVSRHRSMETLRVYVRDADAFRNHAGAGLL